MFIHCYLILGKFCGQRNPGSLRSTGRYALVHFHSDISKSSTGFEIMYEFSKDGGKLCCELSFQHLI